VKILQILFVNIAIVTLLAGCLGGNTTASVADQTLMRADSAFSALSANKGFAAAFEQYATDDTLLLPENGAALKGKTTILKNLQNMPAASALSWSPQGVDVSDDLGYSWGIYTLTGKSQTGQTTVAYGKYLSVWKRQAGDWRLAVMMVNSTPGPVGG
jgi:ketosteroid isomerase-like protein